MLYKIIMGVALLLLIAYMGLREDDDPPRAQADSSTTTSAPERAKPAAPPTRDGDAAFKF